MWKSFSTSLCAAALTIIGGIAQAQTRGRSSAAPLRHSGDGSRPINRRDDRCTLRTREAHDFNGSVFRLTHKPSMLSLRQARDYSGAERQTAQQHKHRKARFEKVLPSSPHPYCSTLVASRDHRDFRQQSRPLCGKATAKLGRERIVVAADARLCGSHSKGRERRLPVERSLSSASMRTAQALKTRDGGSLANLLVKRKLPATQGQSRISPSGMEPPLHKQPSLAPPHILFGALVR
jgi:hypothetical protein